MKKQLHGWKHRWKGRGSVLAERFLHERNGVCFAVRMKLGAAIPAVDATARSMNATRHARAVV